MNVKEAKSQVQLIEWATQVNECRQSGLPVKRWCKENGVAVKSYYYHLKRVREELLDAYESGNTTQIQRPARLDGTSIAPRSAFNACNEGELPSTVNAAAMPVFAALPIPQSKNAPVTVWLGGYAVDIQNGADDAVVAQVLKVVSRL